MARIRRLLAAVHRRQLAMAAVLVAWVLVVAATSGPEPGPGRWLGFGRLPEILWVTYSVICIAVLLFVFVGGGTRPPIDQREMRRGRLWSLVTMAVLLGLFAFAPRSFRPEPVEVAPSVVVEPEPEAEGPGLADPGLGRAQGVALTAIAIVAAAALLWTSLRHRPSLANVTAGRADGDLAEAAAEARRHLLDTADPRMAVLVAYARLEQALDADGRGRDAAETPSEHMARISAAISLQTNALQRLAQLYEHARFSHANITDADRRTAEADLRRLTNDLQSASSARG